VCLLLLRHTWKIISTFYVGSYCHESDIEFMVAHPLCRLGATDH
jgi:hypothetical protein